MSAQTNPFQQLVRRIHETYHGADGSVVESAVKNEPDGAAREVDIRVCTVVDGTEVTIAVECRDRSRNQTIEWIDSAIGKYIDLEVDKIALVASRGFSAFARAKADRHGIELYSLTEIADDADWPASLRKRWLVPYQEVSWLEVLMKPRSVHRVPFATDHDQPAFEISNFPALMAHALKAWDSLRQEHRSEMQAMLATLVGSEVDVDSAVLREPIPLPLPLPLGVGWKFFGEDAEVETVSLRVRIKVKPVEAERAWYLLASIGELAAAPETVVTEVVFNGAGGQPMRATFVETDGGSRVQVVPDVDAPSLQPRIPGEPATRSPS